MAPKAPTPPSLPGLPSPPSPPSPPANFDRVARLYRWAEYLLLGPLLRRTRECFLPILPDGGNTLVLGDGDGRFLAALLRQCPTRTALAVDSSAAMLRLLQRRCRFAASRLETRHTSASSLPAGLDLANVNLVVTHFFLDCLSEPETASLASALAARLPSGSLWLVSEFAYPPRQPWRALGIAYVRGLYAAFRLLASLRRTRLPDIAGALASAGFQRLRREERLKGLLYSELWRLPGELPSAGGPGHPRATSRPSPSSTLV